MLVRKQCNIESNISTLQLAKQWNYSFIITDLSEVVSTDSQYAYVIRRMMCNCLWKGSGNTEPKTCNITPLGGQWPFPLRWSLIRVLVILTSQRSFWNGAQQWGEPAFDHFLSDRFEKHTSGISRQQNLCEILNGIYARGAVQDVVNM